MFRLLLLVQIYYRRIGNVLKAKPPKNVENDLKNISFSNHDNSLILRIAQVEPVLSYCYNLSSPGDKPQALLYTEYRSITRDVCFQKISFLRSIIGQFPRIKAMQANVTIRQECKSKVSTVVTQLPVISAVHLQCFRSKQDRLLKLCFTRRLQNSIEVQSEIFPIIHSRSHNRTGPISE